MKILGFQLYTNRFCDQTGLPWVTSSCYITCTEWVWPVLIVKVVYVLLFLFVLLRAC